MLRDSINNRIICGDLNVSKISDEESMQKVINDMVVEFESPLSSRIDSILEARKRTGSNEHKNATGMTFIDKHLVLLMT